MPDGTADVPPQRSAAAVGCRVEVYFAEAAEWFEGTVTKYEGGKGWFVEYDDGDKEWEAGSRRLRSLGDAAPQMLLEAALGEESGDDDRGGGEGGANQRWHEEWPPRR